jgi:hypothetical protein
MAIRIEAPRLDDTEELLVQILTVVLPGNRVAFLCPAGSAEAMLSRIRVGISRRRKKLEHDGRPYRRFKLRQSVHKETHEGIRYDCIILWTQQSRVQQFHEIAEGLQ